MVPSQKPTCNVKMIEQRVRCHERVGCSRPHARSVPNNRSRVHLRAEVALQAVSGGSVAPAESSMALLQRTTDQPEHWHCRLLPPHVDPPTGRDGEVPSSTTRKPVRYIAR